MIPDSSGMDAVGTRKPRASGDDPEIIRVKTRRVK